MKLPEGRQDNRKQDEDTNAEMEVEKGTEQAVLPIISFCTSSLSC